MLFLNKKTKCYHPLCVQTVPVVTTVAALVEVTQSENSLNLSQYEHTSCSSVSAGNALCGYLCQNEDVTGVSPCVHFYVFFSAEDRNLLIANLPIIIGFV